MNNWKYYFGILGEAVVILGLPLLQLAIYGLAVFGFYKLF